MNSGGDQLKLLSDYTLFHIGLYATLTSALIALAQFGTVKRTQRRLFWFLVGTVVCFLFAGAAGGAIASNIPNFACFADYDHARLETFGIRSFSYRWWAHVEHGAFWTGIIVAVIGFLAVGGESSRDESKHISSRR